MKGKSSISVNFIMNFILTISNFIFPLITFPYVSRILGADGIGSVQFATANVAYFTNIAMLGIPTYGIRAAAKVRMDEKKLSKTVQEILLINTISSLVALVILFIAIVSIPQLKTEKELYLVLSSAIFLNVMGVEWLYRAVERYSYITIRSILGKLLAFIVMLMFIKESNDYIVYGVTTIIASVGFNIFNFINLFRMVDMKPIKLSDMDLKKHLKPIFTFFLLSLSTTIYSNLDTSLLGFMKGNVAVGYYAAAVRIKLVLIGIVTSLGTVLLPRLSFYFETKRMEEFAAIVRDALNFVLLISIPISLFFILNADTVIYFLSGVEFMTAILPLQIILPSIIFIGLSNVTGIQVLVPSNREHLVVQSTVIGAVVNLILNFILIPLFSVTGAALSNVISELIVLVIQVYFLREMIGPMMKSIRLHVLLLAGGLAYLGTRIFNQLILQVIARVTWSNGLKHLALLVASVIVFMSIYGIVLLLLKEPMVKKMLKIFKGILRRDK